MFLPSSGDIFFFKKTRGFGEVSDSHILLNILMIATNNFATDGIKVSLYRYRGCFNKYRRGSLATCTMSFDISRTKGIIYTICSNQGGFSVSVGSTK